MLTAQIITEITANGPMPFEQFMRRALYTPGLGYYSGGREKFGERGDFITAPELSPLFGACVAEAILDGYPEPIVLMELGPGSGRLAFDVLSYLTAKGCAPRKYYLLEVSSELKSRQQALLKKFPQCEWLSQLPEQPINGLILANEVMDAMPAVVFRKEGSEVLEQHVLVDAGKLRLDFLPARPEVVEAVSHLPSGVTSEVNLQLKPWLLSLSECLAPGGSMCLIDYGLLREKYYAKRDGTLRCFYQHQLVDDPLLHIGAQDITAHVDFTTVLETLEAAGLTIENYATQAQFLLGNGLLNMLPDMSNQQAYFLASQAVKKLTLDMGEIFKVVWASKPS